MATTTEKAATAKSTAKTTNKKPAVRLHEREPRLIAQDGAYALAGVTHDAVAFARSLPDKLEALRTEAPAKAKELRETAPDRAKATQGNLKAKVHNQRVHLEAQVRDIRERTNKEFDGRLKGFEKDFDKKAKQGSKVVADLRKDERAQRIETQLNRVLDQAKNTRSQVKAAITSLRRTADVAIEAGREQADTAKSQVKAAATSARKTAGTFVEAGKDLAS